MSKRERICVRVLVIGGVALVVVFIGAVHERVGLNRESWSNYGTPIKARATDSLGNEVDVILTSSRVDPAPGKLEQWWWEWSIAAKDLLTRNE